MNKLTKTLLGALLASATLASPLAAAPAHAQAPKKLKDEVAAEVEAQRKQIQVMVDQIFSYGEPGFQETRTADYLIGILEQNGFTVERGVAGIPTAFTATWGEGGPKIALGSDVDGPLGVSQVPGLPYVKPLVEDAPGHGEGHNSGMPLIVAAAIATKNVMERHDMKGRLMVWDGVAEELLATKAYYVRAGMFDGVDATIFTHVSSEFGTGYGAVGGSGMVSVEYTFTGKPAHSAVQPWDGRSALDAVELMDVAWNFRREHLPITQRSHQIITNGGGQPNVVPGKASIWYYFRDTTFKGIRDLYEIGNDISDAAALATGTQVSHKVLGYAAPIFANKPLAEAAYANIKAVGMPEWSEDDQAFAKAVQSINGRKVEPLRSEVGQLRNTDDMPPSIGGGSDDIGDIMWTVPTIVVGFPANIPNVVFHNQTAAMAMATPIAHKGVEAGAKAVAMTTLDLMTTPSILKEAQAYRNEVQLKTDSYDPLISETDEPAIWLNEKTMRFLRPEMEKYYYDPSKYDTYLEQLGVAYPTVTAPE